MRKLLITSVVLIAILVAALPASASPNAAYPPCGPLEQPTDAYICRPPYIGGELLHLKPGVAFGWLRSEPSSAGTPLTTIWPTAHASMRVTTQDVNEHFDGYQRWFKVTPYPQGSSVVGWIEQASLEFATTAGYPPDDPATQAQWQPPLSGRVKPGIPFLWLRVDPSSAAAVRGTIPANGLVAIIGPSSFDGVQWWWLVASWTGYGFTFGWVEQAHIIAL